MTHSPTHLLRAAALMVTAGLLSLGPSAGAQPLESVSASATPKGARTTTLTITAPGCEGCRIQPSQYRLDRPMAKRGWSTKARKVKDSVATFTLPTARTRGLTFTVDAPWEGRTGYVAVATVAFAGTEVGDVPTLEEAITYQRATACWAGTSRTTAALTLEAHEVEVDGIDGRVSGTIAWFTPTPASWGPSRRIFDGVNGTQDVIGCRKP